MKALRTLDLPCVGLLLLLPAICLATTCAPRSGSPEPAALREHAPACACETGGQCEQLVLERRGETIYICSRRTLLAEARGVSRAAVADVDGDGKLEVLLQWAPPGTDRRRLHVYAAGSSGIEPKWRVSRMSGELLDFTVPTVGKEGGDPVVTLEHLDGRLALMLYRWDGFGFSALCARRLRTASSGEVELACDGFVAACTVGGRPPALECREERAHEH